jgi:hypothetical protein
MSTATVGTHSPRCIHDHHAAARETADDSNMFVVAGPPDYIVDVYQRLPPIPKKLIQVNGGIYSHANGRNRTASLMPRARDLPRASDQSAPLVLRRPPTSANQTTVVYRFANALRAASAADAMPISSYRLAACVN